MSAKSPAASSTWPLIFIMKSHNQLTNVHVQTLERTIYTRGGGSGGAGHLSRKAGALDSLWPLLDFVLVAAAVQSDHLAGSCPYMLRCWKDDREKKCNNQWISNPAAGLWLLSSSLLALSPIRISDACTASLSSVLRPPLFLKGLFYCAMKPNLSVFPWM